MNKTLVVIALLIAQFTFSQDFKFGKVSKAELEEKQHPIDPNANAAVLYKIKTFLLSMNKRQVLSKKTLYMKESKFIIKMDMIMQQKESNSIMNL